MKATRPRDSSHSEKDTPPIARAVVDRTLCIGAGNCCGIAPHVFELDEEGKATVASEPASDDSSVLDAAWSCPTDAISVYGTDGRRIYPPPGRRSYLSL